MSEPEPEPGSRSRPDDEAFLARVVDATVRVGALALLLAWCFFILRPFVLPVVWGIIIAVAVYPAYRWLESALGGRSRMAAGLLTTVGLLLLIGPAVLAAGSVVDSGQQIAATLGQDTFRVPPPPADVASWPIVGEPVFETWQLASSNLGAALRGVAPQLKELGAWLLSAGAGTGLAIVQFVVSIVLAGVLLAGARGGMQAARAIARRLAGERGDEFAELASATVRSVAVGIVGVAVIQATLIGIGLFAAGVPHAGVWTTLCLFLAVLQLPPLIVLLPIVLYVFSVGSTAKAVVFTIWCVLAGASDSLLKPLLLGRGLDVPMIVIFLGAIGGFVSAGFIGLFVGAVILALGYRLFGAWLAQTD